jgi:hypothetical protein
MTNIRKTLDELAKDLADAKNLISDHNNVGIWLHLKTGKNYEVIDVSFREQNMEIEVIYCPENFFLVQFNRPLAEWLDGRYVRVIRDLNVDTL